MTHPVPRMLKLINFFEDFGFSRIVIGRTVNPVNPSPVDCTEEDFTELERQEKAEIIPWVLDKLVAGETPKYFPYSSFFRKMETGEHTTKVSPFKCGACRGTSTVGADGKLYPCHRFVGMEKWIIGDVANGPDIEKCKQFWRDYRSAVSAHCESCWIWTQCKGPCPWEIAQADGTFSPPRHCEFIKVHAAVSAYVYSRKEALCKITPTEGLCKQEG